MFGGGGISGPGGFIRAPMAGGPGGPGGLTRGSDLTDETVFGKVYDSKIVSRMARYLKNYKVGVAIAFVSMVIATLTMLLCRFYLVTASTLSKQVTPKRWILKPSLKIRLSLYIHLEYRQASDSGI